MAMQCLTRKLFVFLSLCIYALGINAQTISEANLRRDITFLASDRLQGRYPGTKGEKVAARYISKQMRKAGLEPRGTDKWYQPFTWKQSNNPHAHPESSAGQLRNGKNVIGFLNNGAEKTIVIGAHYDHLGLGHDGNSLDPNPHGKIHNGADDNASGVAGMLELARRYSKNKELEPVNFLFIAFSGEEAGLIGSKRYCETPTIDLSQVHIMINMDMIGRLETQRGIVAGGVGTSPDLPLIVKSVPHQFHMHLDSAGIGPSDHTSFYLRELPVLFFFTGAHSDYHKPSDDTDKINFVGETELLTYIAGVVDILMAKPVLPYRQTAAPQQRQAAAFKVSLGIMPGYGFDGPGVLVDGVTDGRPAAKAGLQSGDIIMQLGDFPIGDMYSYMDALAKFKSGQTVPIVVKRGNQQLTTEVTF